MITRRYCSMDDNKFAGFTPATSQFLWDLAFNNERPWFLEHKAEFEEVLNRPFKLLAQDTFDLFSAAYPDKPLLLHVARIYRDARRLHGRGPYKDHLWFSIKADDKLLDEPMFWFELGAADYSLGMGFYSATSAQMELFRRSIDANPARFERIAKDLAKLKGFQVSGEEYKKPKGQYDGVIGQWYNRKRPGIDCTRDFGGVIFSPELPRILADAFSAMMPMYDYLTVIASSGKEQ